MEPGNLGTALVWGVLPALVLLAVIYWLDRFEKEPLRLLAIALLAGAIVAPFLAVVLEDLLGIRSSAFVQTTVPRAVLTPATPILEEVIRGLAILAVFFLVRHEIDDLLDGLVYGAVVGVGFGLAANFWAILQTDPLPGTQPSITPLLPGIMVAGFNHVFYGGVIGTTIAAARRREVGAVMGAAALGIAIASGFHLLHDYVPAWVAGDAADTGGGLRGLIAGIPNILGLVAIGVLATWLLGREKVLVGRELREEVTSGVVSQDDYLTVTNGFRRFGTLLRSLGKGDEWRTRRRLYVLEVELAFRKAMTRRRDPRAAKFEDEETYRRRIAETRARLQGTKQRVAR
jgi:protease PrsW